jgi:hypothetical protein
VFAVSKIYGHVNSLGFSARSSHFAVGDRFSLN